MQDGSRHGVAAPAAEKAVALGLKHIAEQCTIIEKLAAHGRDTTPAQSLLATYLTSQDLHEDHRDGLRRDLGTKNSITTVVATRTRKRELAALAVLLIVSPAIRWFM